MTILGQRRGLIYLLVVSMILSISSSVLLGGAYHYSYLDNFLGKGSYFLLGLFVCFALEFMKRSRAVLIVLTITSVLGILYSIGRPGWSRTSRDADAVMHYTMHTFASDIVFWLAVLVSIMALAEALLLRRRTGGRE